MELQQYALKKNFNIALGFVDVDGSIYPCFHRKKLIANASDDLETIEHAHERELELTRGKIDCLKTAWLRV